MKTSSVYVIAVLSVVLCAAPQAFATDYAPWVQPGLGIRGTAHDLSRAGAVEAGRAELYGSNDVATAYLPGGDLDRVCIWCHAPHNTYRPDGSDVRYGGTVIYYPLWNHKVTSSVYTTYSNGTDDPLESDANEAPINHQFSADLGQPGSVSKLCLSCHDGSIGVNAYGFIPGGSLLGGFRNGEAEKYIQDKYRVGYRGLLDNHHPVGFDYEEVVRLDEDIAHPDTIISGSKTIRDVLWNGRVECPTCHDVHNNQCEGEKFLWRSDARSNFCTTCHLKDLPPRR
jgi:hypothetical protein